MKKPKFEFKDRRFSVIDKLSGVELDCAFATAVGRWLRDPWVEDGVCFVRADFGGWPEGPCPMTVDFQSLRGTYISSKDYMGFEGGDGPEVVDAIRDYVKRRIGVDDSQIGRGML